MKLRPINDKILIEPIEDSYKGIIVIPQSAKKDAPMMAKVLAVGPGMLMKNGERWPMPCSEGDTILFERHSGVEIELDGAKFKVIRDDNVLALLVQDKERN